MKKQQNKALRILSLTVCMILCIMFLHGFGNHHVQAETTSASNQVNRDTTLTATVMPSNADYYVLLPESMDLGTLSPNHNNVIDYEVLVVANNLSGGTVMVTADEQITLTAEKSRAATDLLCQNIFEEVSFAKSGSASGKLLVTSDGVKNAAVGGYSGTLKFDITYQQNNNKPTTSTPSVPGDITTSKPTTSTESNNTQSGNNSAELNTGNYTASVSLRKSTDISSVSMCNALFYQYADLEIQGDTTTLTLYVVDPIPNYANDGTPLSNISFTANGTVYTAAVNTSQKVSRYFDAASGFIDEAGNYNSSAITVKLPTTVINKTTLGSLMCSAFVNVVMNTTQEFYVVLSNFVAGETSPSGEAIDVTKSAQISTVQSLEDGTNDGYDDFKNIDMLTRKSGNTCYELSTDISNIWVFGALSLALLGLLGYFIAYKGRKII